MNAEHLHILAEIFAQNALVLGMHADNSAREAVGNSPAWTGKDFVYHANELELLGQRALRTGDQP